MAKKQVSEARKRLGGRVSQCEVVQLPLLPDHEPDVKALSLDTETIFAALDNMVERGYELSLTLNNTEDGFTVSVRASYDFSPNSAKMIFCNAPSIQMALAVAVFKVFTVANGGEWDTMSVPARRTLS